MEPPDRFRYTKTSSRDTKRGENKIDEYMEELMMKRMMKGMAMGLLAAAAVLAAQMALTGVLGFHTAEAIGKTAMTALFLYAVIRMSWVRREARA